MPTVDGSRPRLSEADAVATAEVYLRSHRIEVGAPLSVVFCDDGYAERFAAELETHGHAAATVADVRRHRERLYCVWLLSYERPHVAWWRRLVSRLRGVPGDGRYVFLAVEDTTGAVTRDV